MIRRIVSGGQTGVDRAALDVARALGIEYGGWVPHGRAAEDGIIPAAYRGLRETASADPAARTTLNVRDADATLVVTRGEPLGGSALALETARALGRPVLHVDLADVARDPGAAHGPNENLAPANHWHAQSEARLDRAVAQLLEWLREQHPAVLNVAGPRRSEDPLVADLARRVLMRALERFQVATG